MKGGGQFVLSEEGNFVVNIRNSSLIYLGNIDKDNFKIKYKEDKDKSLKFEDVFE